LAAVLIFPKADTEAVNELLGRENLTQARLPTEFANRPLEQALSEIRQQLRAIPDQLAEIKAQQEALTQRWHPRLLTWQVLLQDHQAQIDVCPNFGQTDHTFVIEGWAPEQQLARIEAALAGEVGDEVMLVSPPLGPDDKAQAPVMFDNPRVVKPFEPLVGLLALPKYVAIDPTPLMAIFMPLFFGLMVGDIGYGLIILALMLYLRRRFKAQPTLRSLAEVLMIGSAWSVLFGLLFGEFFGTLGETIGLRPLWFDRAHQVQALFLLTLGIGAGHIVLGLGLGVGEAIQQKNRPYFMEKVAMLASLAALFLLLATLAGYLPEFFVTPAVALLLVGLAILIFSLGKLGFFLGPLELVSLVGNILSYLRIAAIGLASVYLAMVANALAGFVGNILVGLIIAMLFHALNIALGAFSPTIQSLRLHYVEFFSKFYEGGGEPFRPFQGSIGCSDWQKGA
jgi:V/A-type H+-transporting ATPase subunit I